MVSSPWNAEHSSGAKARKGGGGGEGEGSGRSEISAVAVEHASGWANEKGPLSRIGWRSRQERLVERMRRRSH
jgi:hypothetical protein